MRRRWDKAFATLALCWPSRVRHTRVMLLSRASAPPVRHPSHQLDSPTRARNSYISFHAFYGLPHYYQGLDLARPFQVGYQPPPSPPPPTASALAPQSSALAAPRQPSAVGTARPLVKRRVTTTKPLLPNANVWRKIPVDSTIPSRLGSTISTCTLANQRDPISLQV